MIRELAPRAAFGLLCALILPCVSLWAEEPTAQVRLFDTGASSSTALSSEALSAPARWVRVPEDETAHQFEGDAVLLNDRLAVVLRQGGPGAEVYSLGPSGAVLRTVLAPAPGDRAFRLRSVRVVQNTPGEVAVDASFRAAEHEDVVVRYGLEIGQVFVKTEAGRGADGLWIGAPCRFMILPDFFADDLVVDATQMPVPRAELPSEHFLLHLCGDGEAIVMSTWDWAEQDVTVSLAGQGTGRLIRGTEIAYGKRGKIWVAVIEGRNVWHVREIAENDAGKVIPLDWSIPYAAQWRVDWSRADRLTGSWEMIAEKPNGRFVKYGWFGQPNTIPSDRDRWTTVLGRFFYPCWIDQRGRGYLQPFGRRARSRIRFEGPALVYPINRVKDTPLTAFTVVDIVRATLGVGPCEYVLDVEGQPAAMKGRATCATRDTLNPIYAAGRQKDQRARIERALDEVLVFVTYIRGRIDAYVEFGHDLLRYLDEQKREHPELADFLTEMDKLARMIDERFDARKKNILSGLHGTDPIERLRHVSLKEAWKENMDTVGYVADLTKRFRATLLDYEGKDALDRCKQITGAIVTVGGNQDELVGECRAAVKVIRQRAGLAMTTDPRVAQIALEIRRRTQEILRHPTSYEAPRH